MSEEKGMRVGLLGATFDTGNMGVSALAAGAIKCILNAYPHAQVFLLDYSKESSVHKLEVDDKEVQIPFVNMRFSKKFYLPNNIVVLLSLALLVKIIPFARFRQWMIARNTWLCEIDQAKFIASIAGGDSFSDIYGFERLLYVSLPQVLVLLLGKPLLLLPQTIGPFRGRFARCIARYILRSADRVYSRDFRGIETVHGLSDDPQDTTNLAFGYDVGFVLDPKVPASVDIAGLSSLHESRPLVGLNVSGLLLMGGYTRKNMFGLRSDYGELIRDLISFLIQDKHTFVLLVPHVMTQEPESDVIACEKFFQSLGEEHKGRLGILRGKYDQNEIKFVIGQCDFIIGARMHACIAAVSQCVPAICMAYSDKFIGVMETVGIEDIVVDARKMDKAEMLGVIGKALGRREEVARLLHTKMPEVRTSIMNLLVGVIEHDTQASPEADVAVI